VLTRPSTLASKTTSPENQLDEPSHFDDDVDQSRAGEQFLITFLFQKRGGGTIVVETSMMNRYYLSLLLVITSTGNLATAFVTVQPQSSSTTGSLSSASTKYPSYRENGGEAFRTSVDRMIPNMPGANPNYRPGGNKDLEVFRERDNRFIPNMPGTNPAYPPNGRDLETFRERDNHRIPNMPGANPNYRSRSYAIRPDAPSWVNRSNDNSQVVNGRPTLYDNRRNNNNNFNNNNNQQQPYPTTWNENYYGVNTPNSNNPPSGNDPNVYSNYSTAAAVTQKNSVDNVYYDSSSSSSNEYYTTTTGSSTTTTATAPPAVAAVEPNNNNNQKNDDYDQVGSAAWVDRQLVTIRSMGRLAMEQELYNVHRVTTQLPNDATDEEIACYLLKARLVGSTEQSNGNNQNKKIYAAQNQHYGSTKYPSYYKGSVPRSWIDGAHIYGPRQAIAARRWTST
jgi:hypothetical protein